MRTAISAALALALLLACATTAGVPVNQTWVRVVNETMETLVVRDARTGQRIGWVQPGQSECVGVREGQAMLLADAVAGPTRRSPSFGGFTRGWRWTVRMGDPKDIALSLVPHAPCGP